MFKPQRVYNLISFLEALAYEFAPTSEGLPPPDYELEPRWWPIAA